MDEETIERREKRESAMLTTGGLVLAFIPSILILLLRHRDGAFLAPACAFSIACCFTSAFMLIRRATVWSVVLGIVFLLLNLAISLLLGCVAIGVSIAFRWSTGSVAIG
jgi:hypothetical protein